MTKRMRELDLVDKNTKLQSEIKELKIDPEFNISNLQTKNTKLEAEITELKEEVIQMKILLQEESFKERIRLLLKKLELE